MPREPTKVYSSGESNPRPLFAAGPALLRRGQLPVRFLSSSVQIYELRFNTSVAGPVPPSVQQRATAKLRY